MKHEAQVETLRTLLQLREHDRDQETLTEIVKIPTRVYSSPDILARERETVFRDYPLVVGHASRVREPGSYLLSDWNRIPFVVVRDKEGSLRAFINTCRHRGARLVSGKEAQLKAFVCPFHGWAYGLDGELISVTKDFNFPGLDCSQYHLRELPVVEDRGLIWVHPTPGAKIDLPAYLGAEIHGDLGSFDIARLTLHRKSVVTKNANWKLLIKTYLERYHVPILHRNSIAELFKKGVVAHLVYDPHIRMTAARTNLPDVAKLDPVQWRVLDYTAVLYILFPNSMLILLPGGVASLNSFYPESPDRTIWTHEMLYWPAYHQGEGAQEALAKRFTNIDVHLFGNEDFGIAEDIQAGLDSGANEYHTIGLEEGLVAIFQDSIDRRVA